MTPSPNILVTNDDGIHSHGIFRLWETMEEIGNVTVVAPDTEKSAVGHAITISDPIRIQEFKKMEASEDLVLMVLPQIVLKLLSPPFVKILRILLFPESTPEPMWGIILFIQEQFLQRQKGQCTIFHPLQSV